MANCKYFDVCGLPGDYRPDNQNNVYCILHLPPGPGKDQGKFDSTLNAHQGSGRCDFRWVSFPANAQFSNRRFRETVDFRHVVIQGNLVLNKAIFEKGLHLGENKIPSVLLSNASIDGPFEIHSIVNEALDIKKTIFRGPVEMEFRERAVNIQASSAQFHGSVSIKTTEANLSLQGAELQAGLTLRGNYFQTANLDRATVRGNLDLRDSRFRVLSFNEIFLHNNVTIDLSGSRVDGELSFVGLPTPPQGIILSGTNIGGSVRVDAKLGQRKPCVIATGKNPDLESDVTLKNVDLQNCLLVGNEIDKFRLSNVEWPRRWCRWFSQERWGPRVMYDEIVYRQKKDSIPSSNLREAYQALKQQYLAKGDHVTAGDFHYGEMEMKRRERGRLRQIFCLECLYWLLS
jgi:uncharacterized protein YjbI with pentapeptide repeats